MAGFSSLYIGTSGAQRSNSEPHPGFMPGLARSTHELREATTARDEMPSLHHQRKVLIRRQVERGRNVETSSTEVALEVSDVLGRLVESNRRLGKVDTSDNLDTPPMSMTLLRLQITLVKPQRPH